MGCINNKKKDVDVEADNNNGLKSDLKDGQDSGSSWFKVAQLAFLLCVAALALTSIVLFTEQLVMRHLAKQQPHTEDVFFLPEQQQQPQEIEVEVLQLEDWAHRETIEFENYVSVRAIDTLAMPIQLQPTTKQQLPSPQQPNEDDAAVAAAVAAATAFEAVKQSTDGDTPMVEDGVFWSRSLEAMTPPGLPEIQVQSEMQELRGRKVAHLEEPDWLHCGRDMNRFVTFADGSKACARNRGLTHQHLIQGEVMAFHLARLLGIANTPVVVLSQTSSEQWRWSSQLDSWLSATAAATGTASTGGGDSIVALIQWIPRLTKTPMPVALSERLAADDVTVDPINKQTLAQMDPEEAAELVQWSDLVVFDYLTGNYDRIVSMMDVAEREGRSSMLRETVHNLAQSTKTSSLWMLDNESSFLDAYALMYSGGDDDAKERRLLRFQDKLLRSFCVFRRQTTDRLLALRQSQTSADKLLLEFIANNEPLFKLLPTIHSDSLFSQNFGQRIDNVLNWIQTCRSFNQ